MINSKEFYYDNWWSTKEWTYQTRSFNYEVFYNIAKFILERSDINLIEVKKKNPATKQKVTSKPASSRTFKREANENYKISKQTALK